MHLYEVHDKFFDKLRDDNEDMRSHERPQRFDTSSNRYRKRSDYRTWPRQTLLRGTPKRDKRDSRDNRHLIWIVNLLCNVFYVVVFYVFCYMEKRWSSEIPPRGSKQVYVLRGLLFGILQHFLEKIKMLNQTESVFWKRETEVVYLWKQKICCLEARDPRHVRKFRKNHQEEIEKLLLLVIFTYAPCCTCSGDGTDVRSNFFWWSGWARRLRHLPTEGRTPTDQGDVTGTHWSFVCGTRKGPRTLHPAGSCRVDHIET